jgi:hypothetical protein
MTQSPVQSEPISVSPEVIRSGSTVSSSSTVVRTSNSPLGYRQSIEYPSDDRTAYAEFDILEVSSLLRMSNGNSNCDKVHRTYIVVRVIGQLYVLNNFIELGFSDQWFLVTSRSLPKVLSASLRDEFVRIQDCVPTKSIDIEKGDGGAHRHFAKGVPIPFETGGILCSGGCGQVGRVISLISYKEYTRKCIPRKVMFASKTVTAEKQFAEEVLVLKLFKYRYMVVFVGSYINPKYLVLIMCPVARMDLNKYLHTMEPGKSPELRKFLGCLSTALHYLNNNNIRHKHINPRNILVDHVIILFTDFGLAHDSTEATASTTAGTSSRYRAIMHQK